MSGSETEPRPTIFRESGLVVVFLATLVYVGIVFLAPGSPVRVPFGFFVLVFAPGYALGAMFFARRPLLPPVAEFPVTIGLSVVFNVLVGLVLALVGAGVEINWLILAEIVVVSLGLAVKVLVGSDSRTSGLSQAIRRELRLPGVRPAYRRAVYALLVVAMIAFAGIVYLSVAQPSTSPSTSIALYGPGGTTTSLPRTLVIGEVGLVVVSVANGYAGGPLTLVVTLSLPNGSAVSHPTVIPWGLPLALGPGTSSSLPLGVGYGQKASLNVTFELEQMGPSYGLSFALNASGTTSLPEVSLGLQVTT